MDQESQAAQDEKRTRRRRKWQTFGRVFCLICACILLPVFVTAVWVGYLSWIGICVGIVYLAPGILSPLMGLAGRKQLEGFLSWLSMGMTILLPLAITIAAVWPEDNTKVWRPYRFDEELAALEAERAVPDPDNAALRCEALFARLDFNDQSDKSFRTSPIHDELCQDAWNRVEHPEASRWLNTCSWVVDEFERAGTAGTFRWPLQAYTYDEITVPYKPLGRSIRLLLMSANRNLGERQFDEAITKYFCVIKIAHDLHQQMQLLDWRIAAGCERDALLMIRRALVQHDLSDRNITRIVEHLPPTEDPWPGEIQTFLRAEKLRYMNLLARLYEVNEEGKVRFASTITLSSEDQPQEEDREAGRWFRLYWRLNMPLDPQDLQSFAQNHFAKFICFDGSGSRSASNLDQGMTWSGVCKVMANFYRWFAEIAFFEEEQYRMTREKIMALIAERRGTWLVPGLRRYRDEHGAWPSSLDQVSKYVPSEAFLDPTNDGAFVYARDDEGFALYSKGMNRLDEGGRDRYVEALGRNEDDIAIWPPTKPKPRQPLSQQEREEMFKQLAEIYGDRFPTDRPEDANSR